MYFRDYLSGENDIVKKSPPSKLKTFLPILTSIKSVTKIPSNYNQLNGISIASGKLGLNLFATVILMDKYFG